MSAASCYCRDGIGAQPSGCRSTAGGCGADKSKGASHVSRSCSLKAALLCGGPGPNRTLHALKARSWLLARLACLLCLLAAVNGAAAPRRSSSPNIVIILADDLGYGDVGCYNAQSKIPTPNLDRLAAEGMRFTDAHAPDAVCTPSRYGLLTGRYAFRSRLKSGVLAPWGEPLIEAGPGHAARLPAPARLRYRLLRQMAPGLGLADYRRPPRLQQGRPRQRGLHQAHRQRPYDARLRLLLRRGRAELPALLLHRE